MCTHYTAALITAFPMLITGILICLTEHYKLFHSISINLYHPAGNFNRQKNYNKKLEESIY